RMRGGIYVGVFVRAGGQGRTVLHRQRRFAVGRLTACSCSPRRRLERRNLLGVFRTECAFAVLPLRDPHQSRRTRGKTASCARKYPAMRAHTCQCNPPPQRLLYPQVSNARPIPYFLKASYALRSPTASKTETPGYAPSP